MRIRVGSYRYLCYVNEYSQFTRKYYRGYTVLTFKDKYCYVEPRWINRVLVRLGLNPKTYGL